VTQAASVQAPAAQPESSEAVAWVRGNWVNLTAGVLILAQLWLKGVVLNHAFFRADDYFLIDWSLRNHLTWHFLGTAYGGHLMPGSLTLVWLLARLSIYDWTLVSIVSMALVAAASLALLRLLRTLFGPRPAILLPLAMYLFSPLLLPGLTFWSTSLQWLPTQLVIFMALNAHFTYVRGGRYWHAIVAVGWLVAGLAFDELNVLVPVLLLALTSAFFAAGSWGRAVVDTLRRFWRAWILYAAVAVGYGVLYLYQLPTASSQFTKPGQFSNVLAVMSTLTRVSLVPGALGGPWQWRSIGDYAFAAEYPPWTQLAWSVAALVVLVSLWYRRHALRAWVIAVAWVFLTAVAPLLVGRIGQGLNPQILGTDLHYLADSLPVLVLCVGLAFWPAVGEQDVYRARPQPRLRTVGTVALVVVYLAGALWSYQRYEAVTSTAKESSYLATARAAIALVPRGSVIVNSAVPTQVFPFDGQTSVILGPLTAADASQHLSWRMAPSGVIPHLLAFDWDGRLRQAALAGRTVAPPSARHGCWSATTAGTSISIGSPLFVWSWELGLTYSGQAATLAVTFGSRPYDVRLPAGQHVVYVAAHGGGGTVRAKVVSGGPKVCISGLTIGEFEPSIISQPVPAAPVRG
jgi:hypothetical protein